MKTYLCENRLKLLKCRKIISVYSTVGNYLAREDGDDKGYLENIWR